MSDCGCNPVVGDPVRDLPDRIDYKSYKPGELRLYGRPADHYKKDEAERKVNELMEKIRGKLGRIENVDEILEAVKRSIYETVDELKKGSGVVGKGVTVAVYDEEFFQFLPIDLKGERNYKSIGVIYGYAYEGHCYKLPKPQIMCLPGKPTPVAKGDCGYDPEFGYAVWAIDKRECAIALDIRSDDLKTLVLDENTPGNRSPMAYAQTMALAPQRHRD